MDLSEKQIEDLIATQAELIADLKSKNEKMSGEVADAKKYLTKANKESAERREKINTMEAQIGENETLRKRIFASEHVLKTFNVDFRSADADLKALSVVDGEVTGDFSWDAPKPSAPLPNAGGGADAVLSEDKIASMSKEDINKNWTTILENDRSGAIR